MIPGIFAIILALIVIGGSIVGLVIYLVFNILYYNQIYAPQVGNGMLTMQCAFINTMNNIIQESD